MTSFLFKQQKAQMFICALFSMVISTGFEPVSVALRGRCVNRFTN